MFPKVEKNKNLHRQVICDGYCYENVTQIYIIEKSKCPNLPSVINGRLIQSFLLWTKKMRSAKKHPVF